LTETSSHRRRLVLVADPDARAVHTIDADALTELAVTLLEREPAQILPLADGRVVVSLRDKNRLAVFEIPEKNEAPLEPRCSIPTYAEPWGIAISPDGATVALTAALDHRLTLFASADLKPLKTVELPPEPRGVLISADGRVAWVTHMVGGRVSKILLDAGGELRVTTMNARPDEPAPKTGADSKSKSNKTPVVPATAVQGFAIAEAASVPVSASVSASVSARIFAPMASVHPGQFEAFMGLPSSYGGSRHFSIIHAPFVAVLDPTRERPIARTVEATRSTPHSHACSLPRAALTSGDQLFVACLGIDQLLQLDARAIDPAVAQQRRFDVAPGPSGIAVDARNQRALVASQFEPVLSVADLSTDSGGTALRLELARPGSPPLSAELARGRALFHATRDHRISQDGRSCASCHPDGRADGLTWITPDGPRQTISLAGRSKKSGPFGWFGEHPTLHDHLTFTMKHLGGTGFNANKNPNDKADLAALIAWVEVMPAPDREGALTDQNVDAQTIRERGRDLFYADQTGCSTCHIAGDTDRRRHNVGSGQVIEKSLAFDTPSLRFIGGTAPYFHDGRYPTLFDMLSDPRSKMGKSAALSEADRRALAAFLESL
jgi:mono/diheme cytochrome c family protein